MMTRYIAKTGYRDSSTVTTSGESKPDCMTYKPKIFKTIKGASRHGNVYELSDCGYIVGKKVADRL